MPLIPRNPRILPATPRPRLPPTARRARTPIWSRPLPPGRIPAYDHALRYIRADARALRDQLVRLKQSYTARTADDAKAGRSHDPDALNAYRDMRAILEVQSEINLPEVRWAFGSGRFPFTRPVYRHLTEQKWRKDGALDLLMERLHQMHVIPDLLPALHPSLDLRIQFPVPGPKSGFVSVEPGSFVAPAQTLDPPRVSATVFHPDTRLYTLILLDPDMPNESQSSFQTYIHWLQPNIPLSGTRRISLIAASPSAPLPYIPPHPQRGTPYHRYTLLLLPHSSPLPSTATCGLPRTAFDLRGFCAQWGIGGSGGGGEGGGAHMWRAVWDSRVSDVYSTVLQRPEPQFGRARKAGTVGGHRGRYAV